MWECIYKDFTGTQKRLLDGYEGKEKDLIRVALLLNGIACIDIFKIIFNILTFNTEFLKELVEGVLNNINDIDNNISKYLENWTIDRLGLTDQAIIRISVYELLYTNTPNLVCINEAIELSKKYSDEKVSKMINGVLDKIYHEVEDKSE